MPEQQYLLPFAKPKFIGDESSMFYITTYLSHNIVFIILLKTLSIICRNILKHNLHILKDSTIKRSLVPSERP